MKLVIYAHTPIAGAPWNQYLCLKKYAPSNIQVRFIQQRVQYKDGRSFPKDLLLSDPSARKVLREADVVHIHNYLPSEVRSLINPRKQRVIGTLHSVPRQGNWAEMMKFCSKTFCIRQPMQMREYTDFETLPNLFDIWAYKPVAEKTYDGTVNIVYCPTNKHADNVLASKGYHTVMPLLATIQKERGENVVKLISFTNTEYLTNLRLKSEGHITIDDICGATFHLTSLEGCCTQQAVLTSCPKEWGFPFTYTTLSNIKEKIDYFLDNRDKLAYAARNTRQWVEQNWNPQVQVAEYINAYSL